MVSISFKHSPFFFYGLWFKSHLIRHLGMGRAFKYTQRALKHLRHSDLETWVLGGHSESTRRAVGYLGPWKAIEHSEGTWALRHAGTSGTWALRHLRHSGTWALTHLGTQSTRVLGNLSTRGTLFSTLQLSFHFL